MSRAGAPGDLAAAILAGGASVRFGADKRAATLGGEPLLLRAVRLLAAFAPRVAVLANDRPEGLPEGVPAIADRVAGAGPLGGLHAALHALPAERVLLYAADLPFPSAALLRALERESRGADVVLARTARGPEPLCAFYRRSCLPFVERALAAGERRVVSFFPGVRVAELPPEAVAALPGAALAFFNVNAPGDLARAEGHLKTYEFEI